MDAVRWEERPELRAPVMILAFEGWNDAGDAATTAARHLSVAWATRRFATIDPEEFYDFTEVRPYVRLEDGLTRVIDWPSNELRAGAMTGVAQDVIVLVGVEPQLRWRTFAAAVTDLAQSLGVTLVVSLGSLLASVPHTRPVQITGTAGDAELIARLGLIRSRYEGPTGIVGVLHDAFARAGVPSASLWATVPHYVGQHPSPKAALALVQRCTELLGTSVPATDLEIAAAAYERQVSEAVDGDEDVAAHVRRLEIENDADFGGDASPFESDLSGLHPLGGIQDDVDRLHEDIERFLRDQET